MSGLEQRTSERDEALADASAVSAVNSASAATAKGAPPATSSAAWSAIDGDLLEERRAAAPAVPLELLSSAWREWVMAAAHSADVPVDYVAQALLAAVAGVSGRKMTMLFVSGWVEPLQLWL